VPPYLRPGVGGPAPAGRGFPRHLCAWSHTPHLRTRTGLSSWAHGYPHGVPGTGRRGDGTALVVVDVLDAFDHPSGDRILDGFRRAEPGVREALEVARTRGWRVIYANDDHHGDGDAEGVLARALRGPGRDVVARLAPEPGEPVVLKSTYSGFDETDLEDVLEEASVGRVVVLGAVTEMCVEATAVDAASRGYEAWVLTPATVALDGEEAQGAVGNLRDRGVRVARSALDISAGGTA
jgi:nicotinamidase-related amidase